MGCREGLSQGPGLGSTAGSRGWKQGAARCSVSTGRTEPNCGRDKPPVRCSHLSGRGRRGSRERAPCDFSRGSISSSVATGLSSRVEWWEHQGPARQTPGRGLQSSFSLGSRPRRSPLPASCPPRSIPGDRCCLASPEAPSSAHCCLTPSAQRRVPSGKS